MTGAYSPIIKIPNWKNTHNLKLNISASNQYFFNLKKVLDSLYSPLFENLYTRNEWWFTMPGFGSIPDLRTPDLGVFTVHRNVQNIFASYCFSL